ncbi:MAG: DUF1800 domain-containing protein [Nocardioidaceae bacterium]|nr:DUF1800 domain-containing protein [Nocardioidaceae bacterium]
MSYRPLPYPRTPILDARSLLVLNRFTAGWTPALGAEVRRAGGIDRWFARQLNPGSVPDTFYYASARWWVSNALTPAGIDARAVAGLETPEMMGANYQRWSMVRRLRGERQVQETMAAFWEHHFHVPAAGGAEVRFRSSYGKTLRALALGRFDTLLHAAVTHPCLGIFLGNAVSTRNAPNENLGRELLELHTVGRAAGYTEDDVKASARILTGYRVDLWKTWSTAYDAAAHWTGPVSVLGFSHANADADGRAVTQAYLSYLAHHPATARRIAAKLALRFVSDTPSSALVEHLAQVYLANGTAIAPVLRALVASAEFRASAGRKVRTPDEDLVASYRALGVAVAPPRRTTSAANLLWYQSRYIGQGPFSWPRPDGRPDQGTAWSSVSRVLASFDVHYHLAGRRSPPTEIGYRTPRQWLPQRKIRFGQLVDHLSRSILGRPSTSRLLLAACQATGLRPTTVITAKHPLLRYSMPALLTVFLDNPTHMTR